MIFVMMNRLEFHISYKCLNNCRFCSEHDQLEKFAGQFVPKGIIYEKLKQFSQRGFNHITFTGGEPTHHPYFIEILQSAKELGYKTYVTTNGGLFSLNKFTRQALPYLDEICFSVHGHNAKLHNFFTRNEGSFNKLCKALANVEGEKRDIGGFANVVITKYNFGSLMKIIDFISRYKKITQVLLSNFAPEGNGLHNFKELVVPMDIIKEKIEEISHFAKRKSLVIRYFGLPLCVLGKHKITSNDLWWSPRTTIEKWSEGDKVFLKKTLSYKPVRKRIKPSMCRLCSEQKNCGGIFKRYYQEFGGHELEPFRVYTSSLPS